MALVIIALLLGIMSRTVFPYLQTLRDAPDTKFDRAFLVPAIVTLIIAALTSPFVFVAMPQDQLNNPTPTFADAMVLFVTAWGMTDIAREGQKFISGSRKTAQ